MNTVLGVDPGTAITGWGVVCGDDRRLQLVAYGTIRTPAHTPLPERLLTIYEHITAVLRRYQPDVMAVEKLFFRKNVTTAIAVSHARGVILLAAAQARLLVEEFTPVEVKQATTGYGNADKRQVQEMVRRLLRLDVVPRPDDAADALAVAICRLHTFRP
ncbi:MAG: crossover junction endodeoxyribonuclease RuvC [Ardenticatenia bacterium]|nr:crossover junction endodeoxyribonuclease RuvC [Ardenticatenia bacterium]